MIVWQKRTFDLGALRERAREYYDFPIPALEFLRHEGILPEYGRFRKYNMSHVSDKMVRSAIPGEILAGFAAEWDEEDELTQPDEFLAGIEFYCYGTRQRSVVVQVFESLERDAKQRQADEDDWLRKRLQRKAA